MNALEKALLIKELNLLIDGLEHRSLSFFEIAKSKSRLTEIFGLCDVTSYSEEACFENGLRPDDTNESGSGREWQSEQAVTCDVIKTRSDPLAVSGVGQKRDLIRIETDGRENIPCRHLTTIFIST